MKKHASSRHLVTVVAFALLVAVVSGGSPDVLAHQKGFVFTPLVFLGASTPGGEQFLETFDSSRINNRGDVQFSSLATGGEGREFLLRKGKITELPIRAGAPAPDGAVFGPGSLSPTTLNNWGEAGLVVVLEPFQFPPDGPSFGMNAGVYRFLPNIRKIVSVMTPGVTPAPGGGMFAGAGFGANLNDRGDLVFAGIVPTDKGFPLPDDENGLGVGIFKANRKGHLSSLVSPGDQAPGGGLFDFTNGPWINDRGDVAFMGHVAGEECRPATGLPPLEVLIACLSNVYVRHGATGKIVAIARAGDPAPGGGTYRQAWSPVINNKGHIAFLGDLTAWPDSRAVMGVFLRSGGKTIRVSGPGDEMPGGGKLVTASNILGWQLHMNNADEIVFNATLDTSTLSTDDGDPIPDTGLYVWSHGALRLVARTGTVIPGVGTIAQLVMNVLRIGPPPVFVPNSGAHNNDRGQVVFGARLIEEDEQGEPRGVLLVATPSSPWSTPKAGYSK